MKGVQSFESPVHNLSVRMPSYKFDHMYHNQGRTFGPIFGLFLMNLLAKAVTAKYDHFPVHLSYDPSPWLPYNKPVPTYNYHTYYPHWYPVKNPYNYEPPSYQTYPTLTTAAPYLADDHFPHDYENDYAEDYNYRHGTHDSNGYERLIPAESKVYKQTTLTPYPPKNNTITTTPTPTTTEDHIAAESNVKSKRHPTQRYRRRGPTKRNKYQQKRRRTTAPPPEDYYDSYEDYTERYQTNKRRRPAYNKQSEEYYDEADDYGNNYYDSYEATTRYFNKQKRRPTRKVHKPPPRIQEHLEIESNTERFNPNTEIVIVRQAQASSTTTSSSTSNGSTTTEPTTIITNSTTSPTTTTNASANNGTYGYGPSNGNEQVSFTYGPPTGKNPYQYSVPYLDWYTHEATRNAIVKRVRDIVLPTK